MGPEEEIPLSSGGSIQIEYNPPPPAYTEWFQKDRFACDRCWVTHTADPTKIQEDKYLCKTCQRASIQEKYHYFRKRMRLKIERLKWNLTNEGRIPYYPGSAGCRS